MTFASRPALAVSVGPTAQLISDYYSIIGVGSPASLQFDSTGELWATTTSTVADFQYYWLTGGSAADCKLVYSIVSGSFSGSPPASGSNMGTPLVFVRAGPGSLQTVVASFQIQRVSDSAVLAGPVNITLECGP